MCNSRRTALELVLRQPRLLRELPEYIPLRAFVSLFRNLYNMEI